MSRAGDDQSDQRSSREQSYQHDRPQQHDRSSFQDQEEHEKHRRQQSPNPLSGFKRTIDDTFEALGGLLRHAFVGRPEEMADINKRWTGSEECETMRDPYAWHLGPPGCEVMRELMASIEQSIARNGHIPFETIHALYRDPESGSGNLRRENRWLSVEWFKRNPYSPIRLEAHPQLGQAGTKWRQAFEDLMSASLGKPMDSRDCMTGRLPYGRPQSTLRGPGLDWMFSLQSRGVLPPLLPNYFGRSPVYPCPGFNVEDDPDFENLYAALSIRNPADAKHEDTSGQQPDHELELYEALLNDLLKDNAKSQTSAENEKPRVENDSDRPAVAPVPAPASADADTSKTVGRIDDKRHQTQSGLYLTGDQEDDFDDANDALWEALWAKNADFAAKVLSDWHKLYDSVEELVDAPWQNFLRTSGLAPTSEWFPILTEALRKSQLPEDDVHRDSAYSAQTKQLEQVDKLSLEEKRQRYDVKKQIAELLSDAMNEDISSYLMRASTTDLKEYLERLKQEDDNLEAMFAGSAEQEVPRQVTEVPRTDESQLRKPDVLSIFTTTQTTRLADGTVTTKVVLKKRFADGSEESSESTHTRNERAEEKARQQAGNVAQRQREVDQQGEEKKSHGWFWS